jgi:alpha-D-xyloside xylohydrolase
MVKGTTGRDVYLPPGEWVDYQTGRTYAGGWHAIEGGEIPVVMLVRSGAVIPRIALAQSTADMDWSALELVTFGDDAVEAHGLVCLPSDNVVHEVVVARESGGAFALESNPLEGRTTLIVRARDAAGR